MRYENVTCLCTIQMTSWWKLRGIHCPPLSNYVRDEDKKHSWAVLLAASGTIICTTNYSRDFWHLRNRSTITSRPCTWKQGKHKSYSRRKAGHYGTALCIPSYWHLHFLQSSGQHARWYEKVSFHTCLHRDQPMPIRSSWSHCVNRGYNTHHNESWKQTVKQNSGKKLKIKRGKIQLRAGFVSVPVAGLLQQNWLLASHSPVLLLPLSPFIPLGALCFRCTSNAWCWSQTPYNTLVARCSGILKWVRN